jgi:hypothetical protein
MLLPQVVLEPTSPLFDGVKPQHRRMKRKLGKFSLCPNNKIDYYRSFTNQSIIVWTLKTKSLLLSLYKREELPLFGKEGRGEIFRRYVFSIMDSLVTAPISSFPR